MLYQFEKLSTIDDVMVSLVVYIGYLFPDLTMFSFDDMLTKRSGSSSGQDPVGVKSWQLSFIICFLRALRRDIFFPFVSQIPAV